MEAFTLGVRLCPVSSTIKYIWMSHQRANWFLWLKIGIADGIIRKWHVICLMYLMLTYSDHFSTMKIDEILIGLICPLIKRIKINVIRLLLKRFSWYFYLILGWKYHRVACIRSRITLSLLLKLGKLVIIC